MLALIRAIHAEFRGAYGSPRMVLELRARGFSASKERVERLMQENGIRARHKRKFKVDRLEARPAGGGQPAGQELHARSARTRSGRPTSPTCGRTKAGCIWPSSLICSTVKWWAGPQAAHDGGHRDRCADHGVVQTQACAGRFASFRPGAVNTPARRFRTSWPDTA